MLDRDALIRRFARGDAWFDTSPLYQVLSRTVAADEDLLDLAAEARPGQQPANMLMAATHLLVLKDPGLPFARFFASVRGDDAEPPEGAGAEFAAFCAEHRDELTRILRERLVQTNVPRRGVAVRLAMREVARRTPGPVTLLEIGPSAGIQLLFDRWALETGGRRFGPADAPLTLRTEWRADGPPPDLDDLPPVRDRLGVDLHPVDATDPAQRLWLQALVWPEHRDRFAELATALDAVAADPPTILEGDAIEMLPRLDEERLAGDIPLVVFHAMVRIHVASDRRPAFDSSIAALGRRRRVLHVSMEPARSSHPWAHPPGLLRARTATSRSSKATGAGYSRCRGDPTTGHRLSARAYLGKPTLDHSRLLSLVATRDIVHDRHGDHRSFRCMTCSPTRPCRGWSNASGTVPTIENPSER